MFSEIDVFEHRVLELVRRRHLTEEEAVREVAAMYPGLHAVYLARVRRGGPNLLPELLRRY